MSNTRDEEIIGTGDHTRRPRDQCLVLAYPEDKTKRFIISVPVLESLVTQYM